MYSKRLDILQFGAPVLRAKAKAVTIFSKKLHQEIDAIAETLAAHGGGAALAATQVGIEKRIFVMKYCGEYLEVVNPVIYDPKGWAEDTEGCLSFSGWSGKVGRPEEIGLRYQDRKGQAFDIRRSGDIARCIQHETDHLDGVLFIDRMAEPFLTHNSNGRQLRVDHVVQIAGVLPQGILPFGSRG